MNKSAFIGRFLGAFAFHALSAFLDRFICSDEESGDEESFWESHQFEDSLEKADDLCEIGYTFPKNEVIYKKIAEKKWLSELPHTDHFEIENYVYEKIGDKTWIIERLN